MPLARPGWSFPRPSTILRLWASKTPYVTMFAGWERRELANGQGVPDEYRFGLESPVAAGGRIVDEQDKPVAGAKVEVRLESDDKDTRPVHGDGRVRYNPWLAERSDPATTDAEGRWRIDNVPDHPRVELSLLVTHPEYVSDETWDGLQKAAGITTAMLRQETAALTLKRGVIVEGRVTDPEGKPIKDGLVIRGDDPYFASARCDFPIDAKGRYRLPALKPGETTLTVIAPGWAPQMRGVKLRAGMPREDFRMVPGKPIRLRIVDTAGKPVPRRRGRDPRVAGEEVAPQLPPSQRTRHQGPVASRTQAGYGTGAGHRTRRSISRSLRMGFADVPLALRGGEPTRTIVLTAEHRVTGRVTDATTGQPIPRFTVIPVDVLGEDSSIAERDDAEACKDGRLSFLATRTDMALRLRVEAMGYRTQDGPEFRVGDDASRTQDFRLQPSPPVAGTVVDDARQARGEGGSAARHPHTGRSPHKGPWRMRTTRSLTDAAGHFAFPDPGEPWTVLARRGRFRPHRPQGRA